MESVVKRLLERGSFRHLRRDAEFLAYVAHEHETLEELEDAITKLYPDDERATVDFSEHPRPGELPRSVPARNAGRGGLLGPRPLQVTATTGSARTARDPRASRLYPRRALLGERPAPPGFS